MFPQNGSTNNLIRRGSQLKRVWTVSALLTLCVAIIMIAVPAKASTSAAVTMHLAAQERPLDEAAVSKLIEELEAGLPNHVENEDEVNAIAEQWEAREDLVGKTRTQILGLLFADVKSVVKDKPTQDKIWQSWQGEEAESEKPPLNPVEPPAKPANPPDNPSANPETADLIEVDPMPLSDAEMKEVMNWIGVRVGALRLPFCWRNSYGNTAGEPFTCRPGLERKGLLCYTPCKEGYANTTVNFCAAKCPEGFSDIGAFCQKPGSYGRGAGYTMYTSGGRGGRNPEGIHPPSWNCEKEQGVGNCEQSGALFYPKCKPGFHAVGCCVCSPDCPAGWTDTGTGCTKPTYSVGAGEGLDMGKCRPGFEKDPAGQLCYPTCQKDYHMVGPVCWQNCPSQQSFDCGAGCTTNQGECAKGVLKQVFSPIMAAITLATWGTAGAAVKAGKFASTAPKLAKAFETVKGVLAEAKGSLEKAVGGAENLAKLQQTIKIGGKLYKAGSAVGREIDHFSKEFADDFEDMTSPEIAAEIDRHFGPQAAYVIKKQWGLNTLYSRLNADGFATAKNVLEIVSAADPTGLVGVAEAFMHPLCGVDTPFPTVHPLYDR